MCKARTNYEATREQISRKVRTTKYKCVIAVTTAFFILNTTVLQANKFSVLERIGNGKYRITIQINDTPEYTKILQTQMPKFSINLDFVQYKYTQPNPGVSHYKQVISKKLTINLTPDKQLPFDIKSINNLFSSNIMDPTTTNHHVIAKAYHTDTNSQQITRKLTPEDSAYINHENDSIDYDQHYYDFTQELDYDNVTNFIFTLKLCQLAEDNLTLNTKTN